MRDQVFRAFPGVKVPLETWKKSDGGWVSRYASHSYVEFTTEEGVRVSGELFIPRGARSSYPALIYVKRAEDIIYPVDYDVLLSALENHIVLQLHPRAVDYPVDNYKMSNLKMTGPGCQRPLSSCQAWGSARRKTNTPVLWA